MGKLSEASAADGYLFAYLHFARAVTRDHEMTHDWFEWRNMTCCRRCGIVRRADGKNSRCRGHVKIGLRKTIKPYYTEGQSP